MLKTTALILVFVLIFESITWAVGSKNAAYVGGTAVEFGNPENPLEGKLLTDSETELQFIWRNKESSNIFSIPYKNILDLEYGQKAGRRVGVAIGTALLVSPIGLFALFSKKRKHFLTIGYKDDQGKEQVVIFELGKDIVRTILPILETRSGKKIEFQDKEAEKASKGGN
jgi:hypothetical protein